MALGRHPEQRRQLQDDPRCGTRRSRSCCATSRRCRAWPGRRPRDVELHGVTIPEGDQVLVLYGSANHDERVFDDPERARHRPRRSRRTGRFGHGIHYCLGNAVARLEIRVALQALLERLGDWEVDEGSVERNQLVPTRCIMHAPVSFPATGDREAGALGSTAGEG